MLSEATYCSLRSRNIPRKGTPRLVFFLLQYVIVAEWYFVEKKVTMLFFLSTSTKFLYKKISILKR